MNRTLTNVFLHARNALSSRTIRPICWSCSVTQNYPQRLEYHVLRPLPHTRPININTTTIRHASTKLAKPPPKTQAVKKPAAKKPKVKVKKSTAKKQRIKKKAAKKKEKKGLKRKALA